MYTFANIMRKLLLDVLNIMKQEVAFKKFLMNVQPKSFKEKKHSMNNVFVLTF